ncbi:MAG TPA: 5-(carboxyamino)imidazole ribonucleotide synthase [Acidimicrobiales bacterium]|nr:5-(carboxyamino)imidazole ribonucleotide synthase [Acidimicrobiales bacterium]
MLIDSQPTGPVSVGVVGAGQLARMMGEAAHGAGVILTVLATSLDDSAVATADAAIIGPPDDVAALDELAALVDVITFDHELVELDQIEALERRGAVVRPDVRALRFAVDKGHQRRVFDAAGIPVPRFIVVSSTSDPMLKGFLDSVGAPVLKTASRGYDGRGVLFPQSRDETLAMIDELSTVSKVVVEERLALRGEAALVVVRGVNGEFAGYPLVSTVQSRAMCVEVRYPADVDEAMALEANRLGRKIANLVGAVGVLAIEFFVCDRGLVVNEIALRPHNTGHWTIEGARTSQFTNHLLAVSGRALGSTEPIVAAAVMVNVVGAEAPGSIENARLVRGAHVHDYGKSWRPGRKLGHVTVVGDDAPTAHVTAWESARAYGTGTRET